VALGRRPQVQAAWAKIQDPTWKITKAKWARGMAQVLYCTCLASTKPGVQTPVLWKKKVITNKKGLASAI
jgi:hypothetical protein